jgi:uncharacterized linocin/CFP29 family protein
MDLLKRELAPILPDAWKLIDDQAIEVLTYNLTGRKLVDLDGPHGWRFGAVDLGKLSAIQYDQPGVTMGYRQVQPVVEIRAPIRLDITDLDDVARGSRHPDLGSVVDAAEKIAMTEDGAIFHGCTPAGIVGMIEASPHEPRTVAQPAEYPRAILEALAVLRGAGVTGPFAIALGPEAYDDLFAATNDGYPIAKQIQSLLIDGPLLRTPALQGAVVLSIRGGDYEITLGQDLSIGYSYHDERTVHLYLVESFTFRVLEPAAAVYLKTEVSRP